MTLNHYYVCDLSLHAPTPFQDEYLYNATLYDIQKAVRLALDFVKLPVVKKCVKLFVEFEA